MAQENEHKSKKGGTKVGAVIILIISAIVFLPVGGAAVFQGLFNKNKSPSFGSYNNKKITYEAGSKFATYASNVAQNYQRAGIQLNEQSYAYIMQLAFRQTLFSMAYSDAVKKSGYEVPAVAISRAILPRFTDETGKYSAKLYNQTDESTLTTLRREATDSLTFQRYTDDVFGTQKVDYTSQGLQLPVYGQFNNKALFGLKVSSKEVDFISKMECEKKAFNVTSFNTQDYPASEAIEFAKENAEKFIKYNLSALCFDSESEAKATLKQIKAGEITFEDAVQEKSQKYYTNSEGKISNSYRYQIANILKNEENLTDVISTPLNEYSSVIQANRGYIVFRTDGESTAADFTSEDLANDVLSYMKISERGTIENYYLELAKNFINAAYVSSFDSACKANGLTSTKIPAFALNYGNTSFLSNIESVGDIPNLASDSETLTKAFSLSKGEMSEPISIGNKIVILECTDVVKAEKADSSNYEETIASTDSTSANYALMTSSRVKDNFSEAYQAMFTK